MQLCIRQKYNNRTLSVDLHSLFGWAKMTWEIYVVEQLEIGSIGIEFGQILSNFNWVMVWSQITVFKKRFQMDIYYIKEA